MELHASLLIFAVVSWVRCTSPSDQTTAISLASVEGTFAGYGDFNSDQATDIFVISHDCKWNFLQLFLFSSCVI